MSAPLGPYGLAVLTLTSWAIPGLLVVYTMARAHRRAARERAEQDTYDAEFTAITLHYQDPP